MNFETGTLKQLIREQDSLYEYLFPEGYDLSTHNERYNQYLSGLNGFDARSFRRTISHLLNSETVPSVITRGFEAVPDYISARSNFDSKRREILEMDGTQKEKQDIFDTLDRARTRAHNGVIELFNALNQYAKDNNIAVPFVDCDTFDRNDLEDRERVANILSRMEPLMVLVNNLMSTKETELDIVDTLRTMPTLGDQVKYLRNLDNLKANAIELNRG